jgi:PAS domain S-box-containing protein
MTKQSDLKNVSVSEAEILSKTVEEELSSSNQKLRENDERLKAIIDNLEEGLVTVDPESRTLSWNPVALKMHGYKDVESKWEFLSKIGEMIETTTIDGKFLEIEQWPISRMMRGENFRDYPMYLYNKEQGWKKLFLYSGKLVHNSSGKPLIGFLSMRDITGQKKAEDALRENEERFRALADNISQLAWMTDESGFIFWYNKRWYDYTGTTPEEMEGWGWKTVHHPDHIDRVMENWTGALKKGKSWEDIFPLKSKDGEYGWFLSRADPIKDENGKILRWFGTNTDITERMKYEDALKEAYNNIEERLNEKEVLLRELYHRTKNNMQVVYSLLGLKGAAVEDKATKEILLDVGNRILAIALVHEKLYQSQNLSRIDLKDYINDLIILLRDSFTPMGKNIKLSLELESTPVLIDTAIPCGMILNELISNSYKYAFPNGREGEIHVRISRIDQEIIELRISDNGIGITDYSEKMKADTLGVKLIKNIAEDQLQGDIILDTQNGVSYIIRFKDSLYKERV